MPPKLGKGKKDKQDKGSSSYKGQTPRNSYNGSSNNKFGGSNNNNGKFGNNNKPQSNNKFVNNNKGGNNNKGKFNSRHTDVDDDDSNIEIDGEYDFDSDVEVLDLSAMLDAPEERKKQTRKGGKNKHLAPVLKSKPTPGSKKTRFDAKDDDMALARDEDGGEVAGLNDHEELQSEEYSDYERQDLELLAQLDQEDEALRKAQKAAEAKKKKDEKAQKQAADAKQTTKDTIAAAVNKKQQAMVDDDDDDSDSVFECDIDDVQQLKNLTDTSTVLDLSHLIKAANKRNKKYDILEKDEEIDSDAMFGSDDEDAEMNDDDDEDDEDMEMQDEDEFADYDDEELEVEYSEDEDATSGNDADHENIDDDEDDDDDIEAQRIALMNKLNQKLAKVGQGKSTNMDDDSDNEEQDLSEIDEDDDMVVYEEDEEFNKDLQDIEEQFKALDNLKLDLAKFGAQDNNNNSDEDDDDDTDDEDAKIFGKKKNKNAQTNGLLNVADLLKKDRRDENDTKRKIKQLTDITQLTRKKGELFGLNEQIGDTSIAVDLSNLNQAISTISSNQDLTTQFVNGKIGIEGLLNATKPVNSDADDEDGEANVEKTITPTFAHAGRTMPDPIGKDNGKLSISSLLTSLKATPVQLQVQQPTTNGFSTSSLLNTLQAPALHKLEKSAANIQVEQKKQDRHEKAQLGDVAKGRLERKEAFKDKRNDITKFQGVILANRGAEQLDFIQAKKTHNKGLQSAKTLQHTFTATNDLEKDLSNVLKTIGVDYQKQQKLQQQQQILSLQKNITPEELLQQQQYLAKMKLMAYYEQQRASRIAKIKSRAQRRYIRKQKDKLEDAKYLAEDGTLRKDLPLEELQRLELQFERQRIKERALLTHKNTSEWAKRQKRIAAKDNTARKLLTEQLRLGQELRKKLGHKDSNLDNAYNSEDELNSASEGDDETEKVKLKQEVDKMINEYDSKDGRNQSDYYLKTLASKTKGGKGSALFNLPFMQRAAEKEAKANRDKLESLKHDLELADEWDSDADDETKQALTNKHLVKAQAGNDEDRNIGLDHIAANKAKKMFIPTTDDQQANNYVMDADVFNDSDDGDNEIQALPTGTIPHKKSKQRATNNIFGGVFDVGMDDLDNNNDDDDNNQNDSATKSITSSATHALGVQTASLAEQKAQRERILRDMRSIAKQDSQFYCSGEINSDNEQEIKQNDSDNEQQQTQKQKQPRQKQQMDDNTDDDDDDDASDEEEANPFMNNNNKTVKKEQVSDASDDSDEEEANPWLTSSTTTTSKKSKSSNDKNNNKKTDVTLNLGQSVLLADNLNEQQHSSIDAHKKTEKDIDGLITDVKLSKKGKKQQQEEEVDLVQLAFANAVDDEEEFEQLKLRELENELPQEDPFVTGTPGWGSWAGMEKSKKQLEREAAIKQKHKEDIQKQREAILNSRSDVKLKNVVINQKLDKSTLKYQIQHIPYPFTSIEEYQAYLATPLGREWNSMRAHHDLTKRAVKLNAGQVIEAMQWKQEYAQISKTGYKRRNESDLPEELQAFVNEENEKKKKVRKQPTKGKPGDNKNSDKVKKVVKKQKH